MDVRGHYKVHRMAPDEALQKYIVSASRDAVMFADDPLKNPYYVASIIKDFRGPATNVRYSWAPPGGSRRAGWPRQARSRTSRPRVCGLPVGTR
jgi:hypothetical protein